MLKSEKFAHMTVYYRLSFKPQLSNLNISYIAAFPLKTGYIATALDLPSPNRLISFFLALFTLI